MPLQTLHGLMRYSLNDTAAQVVKNRARVHRVDAFRGIQKIKTIIYMDLSVRALSSNNKILMFK